MHTWAPVAQEVSTSEGQWANPCTLKAAYQSIFEQDAEPRVKIAYA